MGFGLYVPQFKSAFDMSALQVGIVSSIGFLGLFLSLVVAQTLLNQHGPKAPVVTGLLAATVGMSLVASASGVMWLAAGVFLAAASAGFAWTPFNDAVHRKVNSKDRPDALARISTGTSVGIILAAATAFAVVSAGLSWRIAWAIFAAAAALTLLGNWVTLKQVEPAQLRAPSAPLRVLFQNATLPLFLIAFVFGVTSATYISFAADRFRDAGGVPGVSAAATPALMFGIFGIFGLFGLATERAEMRVGLVWLLRGIMASAALSLTLVAFWPDRWLGLVPSAALQGMCVMMTSAVLAFWTERLFPQLPSMSFTAALMAYGSGSIVGPALAGFLTSSVGVEAMFLSAAGLPLALALFLRPRHIQDHALPDTSKTERGDDRRAA